jgi:hypothetical protein
VTEAPPPDETARSDAILKSIAGAVKAKPDDDPKLRRRNARADEADQTVRLQKLLSRFAIAAMGGQLFLADGAFIAYGFWNDWRIPPETILGWLSATVIEVIGIVLVITRHLFPGRKRR